MERITGFDEGPVSRDWIGEFEARGIRVTKGIGVGEAIKVFQDYAAHVANGCAVLYNARGTGRSTLRTVSRTAPNPPPASVPNSA